MDRAIHPGSGRAPPVGLIGRVPVQIPVERRVIS
jgi:hypothetical protein